ncbi:hypothetical protein DFH94DRAFT_713334 [Russula ochroleuca]|uniref:Uncharacterized protein n=1 Tax=Russula ochroleuca TaxID=152965 RepID=A0A9P5JUJ6_9AGAM|nr:hypothetical protein DFH94DRAFT_789266 [Russula ochroleuca]KAF8486444.1 hypothetical protein DFH94DRAFT_713334 [Russula ochroleuca]
MRNHGRALHWAIGDTLAARRITRHFHGVVRILDELARPLLAVHDGCNPDMHVIRPWFNGADSGTAARLKEARHRTLKGQPPLLPP